MDPNEPTNKKPEDFVCMSGIEEQVPEVGVERNDEAVAQVERIESDDESTRSDSQYGAEWNTNRDSDAQSVLLEGDSDSSARSNASTRFYFTTSSESSDDSRSFVSTDYGSEIMSLDDPFSSASEMDSDDDAVINDEDGNPIDMSQVDLFLGPTPGADFERRHGRFLDPQDLQDKVLQCIKQYQIELLKLRIQQTATKVARVMESSRVLMLARSVLGEQQLPPRAAAPDLLDPDRKPDPIVE